MRCSQCGREIPANVVRCPSCQTPVVAGFDNRWRVIHIDHYEPTSDITEMLMGEHLIVEVPGFERDLGFDLSQRDWFIRALQAGGWQNAGTTYPASEHIGWKITRVTFRKGG